MEALFLIILIIITCQVLSTCLLHTYAEVAGGTVEMTTEEKKTIGGKRRGAGRPPIPEHLRKISYANKIRPDQVGWLQSKKRGFAAQFLEKVIDDAMQAENEPETYHKH